MPGHGVDHPGAQPEPAGGPGQHAELDEHVPDQVLAVGQKQPVKTQPLGLRGGRLAVTRHRKAMQPDLARS
jgi:hypothetical protein